MAYSKHTWTDNELITKEKLNNIENGIANVETTPGPAGAKGDTGNGWLFGQNAPNSEGRDGDLYYKYNSFDVYKKTGGSWQSIGNLKGPQGEAGVTPGDATISQKGIVKMAAAVGTISTANVGTAISGTSADEQLEAMRTLLNESKGKINEIITKLKTAGIME